MSVDYSKWWYSNTPSKSTCQKEEWIRTCIPSERIVQNWLKNPNIPLEVENPFWYAGPIYVRFIPSNIGRNSSVHILIETDVILPTEQAKEILFSRQKIGEIMALDSISIANLHEENSTLPSRYLHIGFTANTHFSSRFDEIDEQVRKIRSGINSVLNVLVEYFGLRAQHQISTKSVREIYAKNALERLLPQGDWNKPIREWLKQESWTPYLTPSEIEKIRTSSELMSITIKAAKDGN